jgi:GntR family transcriptional repressor for pyruvate dehydrogenase complex
MLQTLSVPFDKGGLVVLQCCQVIRLSDNLNKRSLIVDEIVADSGARFSQLPRNSLSDSIVQRFKDLISSGKLYPGEKLPSIKELAENFGVGLSSIREALTALTALGIIETRVGEGTYIRADLAESVLQPLTWTFILTQGKLTDLLEARQLIEVHLAGLAAVRATSDEIEELRSIAEQFKKAIGNQDECLRLDLEFHMAIARAAKNIVLRDLLIRLATSLSALVRRFLLDVEGQRLSSKGHDDLIDAIAAHNAPGARQVMNRHLLDPDTAERYLHGLEPS